jgi:hypothetical protein
MVETKEHSENSQKTRSWNEVWHFGNGQKQSHGILKTVKKTKS